MVAVVEPYYKSLETGRRMAFLARDLGLERVVLVANKIRDDRDRVAIEEFSGQHGLEVAGIVPYDERLPEAERAQTAPLDFAPDAPAVRAIADLAERVLANGRA